MQFIDFKKEHFTKDENTNSYLLEVPKDEIGFGTVSVHKKTEGDQLEEADYELVDDRDKVTIKMKNPEDIRINF
ncbi:hypothetical protein [Epilithonimonas arachidiradicis]|uniref:Uncharacterized protein n=1 Tax=Epilithonimonas arachidiradicis TaxID=1617282 RepID=A0A420D906_9FLAO|nr:hypothetical protein [Epilithonimonas arachidiradicis]RKE87261.1 hypothetical protein BXY58_2141 [Epilithonimonas arachidiradicis]GGG59550.1 hypothetical protein GCM10007332_21540 [Epilithonimonas arachidiradicis]